MFTLHVLVHFKYTDLLAEMWNFLFQDGAAGESILAPLGISFITFSSISYLTDIYRGNATAGSLFDCALYITFFPKVVSDPIILWKDFASQIRERTVTLSGMTEGINRIMIGFAKKLVLADTFGACIASAKGAVDTPTVIGVTLLYMLQIYYDFSGYSDIAIGISNLFGFTVKENFRFPYLSCSITEFWQRWHISLGTWFREYIYFPMGGSRVGKLRTVLNVAVVFLLTGFWHGAGWSYILWGLINGLCNIIEKLLKDTRFYQKIPRFLKWFATMTVTYFCWVLFRFEDFAECGEWFNALFGITRSTAVSYTWRYYFNTQIVSLIIVAILGATIWGLPDIQKRYQQFIQTKRGYLVYQIAAVILFIVSIMFMISSDYSPFIYFQY